MDEMKSYVTYDADGNLDGSYLQVPPDVHKGNMIEVEESVRMAWTFYRANEARDGVELIPEIDPKNMEIDPQQ